MKITDVKPLVMGTSWRNLIFIKVETDEGITGISEATLQNREEAVLAYLDVAKTRYVTGSNPFNIEDLWTRMYRDDFWRGGDVAMTVISAVEVACYDIMGKATGQPVYNLLGGACRDRIKAYANGWYTVERTPEAFAERVKVVQDKGFKALKVDPFGAGHYELTREEKIKSTEIIEAVRSAAGDDFEIFVEAHGRFSPQTAIEMANNIAPFNPGWYEEPVPPENIPALKKVSDKVTIPIATGERFYTRFGYREVLEANATDIIQPDLIHTGGLLEGKKIAGMADTYYITVAPHNSNGPVCTTLSLHFAASTPNFKIQEVFDDFQEPFVIDAVKNLPRAKGRVFRTSFRPRAGN